MPVLLSEESEFETWLSGSPDEAFALAKSFDPAQMRVVQSGMDKEDLLVQAHVQNSRRCSYSVIVLRIVTPRQSAVEIE